MASPTDAEPRYACVEAGGTKFVMGIADGAGRFALRERLPTRSPDATLAAAVDWFAEHAGADGYAAVGIASFGPVELDPLSPRWGEVLATPKPGWAGASMTGPFARRFAVPVGFDTDVNGAILAESLWGAAAGAGVACYVTVGTGIGGGVVVDGRPVHGDRHPEMGHMPVRRHTDDGFAGTCPFHGDCLEGLASGPAIAARWGASLSELGADHAAQRMVAWYLAQLVVAQQALLSPSRIIMGGGVMQAPGMIARVAQGAADIAAGYFGTADYTRLVVAPGLGDDAGLRGALALAQRAAATA